MNRRAKLNRWIKLTCLLPLALASSGCYFGYWTSIHGGWEYSKKSNDAMLNVNLTREHFAITPIDLIVGLGGGYVPPHISHHAGAGYKIADDWDGSPRTDARGRRKGRMFRWTERPDGRRPEPRSGARKFPHFGIGKVSYECDRRIEFNLYGWHRERKQWVKLGRHVWQYEPDSWRWKAGALEVDVGNLRLHVFKP